MQSRKKCIILCVSEKRFGGWWKKNDLVSKHKCQHFLKGTGCRERVCIMSQNKQRTKNKAKKPTTQRFMFTSLMQPLVAPSASVSLPLSPVPFLSQRSWTAEWNLHTLLWTARRQESSVQKPCDNFLCQIQISTPAFLPAFYIFHPKVTASRAILNGLCHSSPSLK